MQYVNSQSMQTDKEVAQQNMYNLTMANLCHKQEVNL